MIQVEVLKADPEFTTSEKYASDVLDVAWSIIAIDGVAMSIKLEFSNPKLVSNP